MLNMSQIVDEGDSPSRMFGFFPVLSVVFIVMENPFLLFSAAQQQPPQNNLIHILLKYSV